MKRVICLILVAALMLGFIAMIGIDAFATEVNDEVDYDDLSAATGTTGGSGSAETDVVSEAEVYVYKYAPGMTVPGADQIVVANTVGLSYSAQWGTPDEAPTTDEVFEAGKQYYLTMYISAPEGKTFDTDVYLQMEGHWYSYSWDLTADCRELRVYLSIKPSYDTVSWVDLSELPEEIAAGAAQAPEVEVLDGYADVTNVQWVNADKQSVTSFVSGNVYYLAVSLKAENGYEMDEDLRVYGNGEPDNVVAVSDTEVVAYFRYSLVPDAGTLEITLGQPAQGMNIADLTATVTGNATVKDVVVYDVTDPSQELTGTLAAGKTYQIIYILEPKAGYEFSWGNTFLDISGEYEDITIEAEKLQIITYFSTGEKITQAEISIPEIALGGKVEDIVPTVAENANYTISKYTIYAYNDEDEQDSEIFTMGVEYQLNVWLEPKAGYAFAEDCVLTINGQEKNCDVYGGGLTLFTYPWYAFHVSSVELYDLSNNIQVGEAELPELRETEGQVEITGVKWVDANKQPVTAFQDASVYYLAVNVEAVSPREFTETPDIYVDHSKETEFVKLSATEAVIYIRYSLEPDVGDIDITVSGLQQGANIADVTATVNAGNVTVTDIEIMERTYNAQEDYYSYDEVTDGKFEANKVYKVYYTLSPKTGYRFSDDVYHRITVNGQQTGGYEILGESIRIDDYFHTCKEIAEAALTVTTPKVGTAFSKLQVKAPSGANFTVRSTWWDSTAQKNVADTDKVQEGHKYYVDVYLVPNEGYVFSGELNLTLNGKELNYSTSDSLDEVNAWTTFSFLKKITKVELPAMTKSVKKGDTLPTSFKLSGSKNYTLTARWSKYNAGTVTKAEENGVYMLYFIVEPKEGYEFDEDVKIYVNDKQFTDENYLYVDSGYVQVAKAYNVGMKEIEKVELSVPALEAGKAPGAITVPEGVKYAAAESAWAQGTDGDVQNSSVVTTLTDDLFTWMGVLLQPEEGYVFADDTVFYVNGKKVTPAYKYNDYYQYVVYLPMGKLGEIEKLTAPKVEKNGETLTWAAVANADSYEIYRATSKSGKYTKVDTVTDTSWTDSASAKTYYYKVKAIYSADSTKNSGYSSVVSVVFKVDAPTVTVENDSKGKPKLSWEKVTGAKKYTVYRATSETGKYSKLGTTTKLTYTDSKAKSGTTYFYKVIANASKSTYNSAYSNIVSCNVICGTPSVTVKIDAATGKPTLSWKKVDGAAQYVVARRQPGEEVFYIQSTQTELTFTDKEAAIDTKYEYVVQALGKTADLDGNPSGVVSATSGIARPAVKGTVDKVTGKPVLTWDAVEGAVKYEIYRSTKSGKSYKLIDTVEELTFTDATLSAGKTYYYKVKAIGAVSKSADSSYVKLASKCATPEIAVKNADSGKPYISWEKVSGAKKYTVYRATSETGKYSKLGTTTKAYYTDSKAKSGTTYFYKIVANASKSTYNSEYSNIVSCNVICGTPSVTVKIDAATGKPTLSWKKIEGAALYRILRQLPGEEAFTVLAEQPGTSFKDTTAPIDTECVYMVQALGKTEELNGQLSKEISATSGIARPAVKGTVDKVTGKPVLTWDAVEGAVKYEIYRSTKSGKSYKLIDTVEELTFTDATLSAGKTYYYKVKAVGLVSESADSSYVKLASKCATPVASAALHETSGKPVITWEKISGAKKYTVYRATSETGKYTKLGTTTKLTYTDSKAVPGTTYFYKVVANASSSTYNSEYSQPTAGITGYVAAPTVTVKNNSKGQITVSWKKVSGAEKYYVVYVDITELDENEEVTEQYILENLQYVELSSKKTSVTLTGAQTGRWYMVLVVAMPKNVDYWNMSMPEVAAATLAAPKISGKYYENYNCGTWKAISGAECYAIYRSEKKNGEYTLLGYIDNDASFVDLSTEKGKTYYYKVTACTEYTESAYSNIIKLKAKK